MELISPSKIRYGNYLFPLKVSSHTNDMNQLLELFSKHKFSPMATCSVPEYWAAPINLHIREMVKVDPKIEIGHIREKNGRLSMNVYTSLDKAIYDLLWAAKNAIDRTVCNRINMCKVEDIDKKWLAIPTNIGATNAGKGLLY